MEGLFKNWVEKKILDRVVLSSEYIVGVRLSKKELAKRNKGVTNFIVP